MPFAYCSYYFINNKQHHTLDWSSIFREWQGRYNFVAPKNLSELNVYEFILAFILHVYVSNVWHWMWHINMASLKLYASMRYLVETKQHGVFWRRYLLGPFHVSLLSIRKLVVLWALFSSKIRSHRYVFKRICCIFRQVNRITGVNPSIPLEDDNWKRWFPLSQSWRVHFISFRSVGKHDAIFFPKGFRCYFLIFCWVAGKYNL